MQSHEWLKRLKRVENGNSTFPKEGCGGVEKVESPLGLNLSTLPDGSDACSASEIAQATFDGTWVYWRDAEGRVRIPPPAWLAWPSHTAAEMGPPLSTPAERAAQSKAKRR